VRWTQAPRIHAYAYSEVVSACIQIKEMPNEHPHPHNCTFLGLHHCIGRLPGRTRPSRAVRPGAKPACHRVSRRHRQPRRGRRETNNKEQTNALNPDNQSEDAKTQAAAGEALLDQINSKQGDAYSKAYVAAMITGHTDALAALDDKLIPATASPQAKAHLQQTREHVARHLTQARALAKDEKQAAPDKAE